jgi:hypothetical protein
MGSGKNLKTDGRADTEPTKMLEAITLEQLSQFRDRLRFPYQAHLQFENDGTVSSASFVSVATCTAAVRPRNEWNTLGREVYDRNNVIQHAEVVAKILRQFDLTDFLVQQAVPEGLWLRDNTKAGGEKVQAILAYLHRHGIVIDISNWHGGFIERGEVREFLTFFGDYPYLLNYYDLHMFSLQADLAMSINHHLGIVYTSTDRIFVEQLKTAIMSFGILEFPRRGVEV